MTEPKKIPRAARMLDLRFVIAVMFAIFGVLVTLSGLTASNEEIDRAAGINISLWTGLGLLLLSAFFGIWVARVPPDVPEGHDVPAEGDAE
ncbi:MAG: hypothetical protein U0R64_03990 [Candidatus Nanopelagicales bacterium]